MAIQVQITKYSGIFRYNCDGSRNQATAIPISLGSYEWSEGVTIWLRPASGYGGTPFGQVIIGDQTTDLVEFPYFVDNQNSLHSIAIPPNAEDIPDGSLIKIKAEYAEKSGLYPAGFLLNIDGVEHAFGMLFSNTAPKPLPRITFEVPEGKRFVGFENEQTSAAFLRNFKPPSQGSVISSSEITQEGTTVTWAFHYSTGNTGWRMVDAVLEDDGPPGPVMKTIDVYLDVAKNAYLQSGKNKYTTGSATQRIGYFETTDGTGETVKFDAKANDFDVTFQYSSGLNTIASSPAIVNVLDVRSAEIVIPKDISYYENVDAIHISVTATTGWMPINWELPNAKAEPQDLWWRRDVGYTTRIIPDGGYVVKKVEVRHDQYVSSEAEITFNLDGTVFVNIPARAGDINQSLGIYVETEQVSAVDHIIVQALNHCTSNIVSETVPDGGDVQLSSGDKISLTVEPGYVWETPPNAQVEYNGETFQGYVVDGLVAFDAPVSGIVGDIRIRATAILQDEPTEALDLGFINVYHPTKDELMQAANSSWWGQDKVPEYIVSVYKTFIKPVEGNQKTAIKFGPYNTHAYAFPVVDQYAFVDCGVITLPEHFNSSLDYEPVTTLLLWLPFIGMQSVSASDVMNIPVSLRYKMNVLTGDVIAELRNNSNGVLLGVWTGTCKEKITVWVNGRWEQENLQPGMTAITMSDRTPCFIRRTGIVVDAANSSRLDKAVKKLVNLADVVGWAKFNRVHVDGIVATSEEKSEIEQLLKEGVIL